MTTWRLGGVLIGMLGLFATLYALIAFLCERPKAPATLRDILKDMAEGALWAIAIETLVLSEQFHRDTVVVALCALGIALRERGCPAQAFAATALLGHLSKALWCPRA